MLRKLILTTLAFSLIVTISQAQVDQIKQASSSRSTDSGSSGGGSSNSGGSFIANFFFQFAFVEVINAQQRKLEQKRDVPSVISLDVLFQGAAQPSSYYILNPRIRGNWGVFSTDFRFNYLIEEDFDGVKYLRTNDWQIVQVNFVNTRDVTVRIGGGVMQEAFGDRKSYTEWTGAVHVRPFGSKLGGILEYRGAEARKEVNGHLQYTILEKRRLRGYVTAGAAFQRYYDQINVWGLQGGLAFSVF